MSYKVLTSEAELNEALSNDSFLLFKHSLTCPISAEAKEEFEKFLDDSSLPAYMIHIQDNRDLSNQVAVNLKLNMSRHSFLCKRRCSQLS